MIASGSHEGNSRHCRPGRASPMSCETTLLSINPPPLPPPLLRSSLTTHAATPRANESTWWHICLKCLGSAWRFGACMCGPPYCICKLSCLCSPTVHHMCVQHICFTNWYWSANTHKCIPAHMMYTHICACKLKPPLLRGGLCLMSNLCHDAASVFSWSVCVVYQVCSQRWS